MDPDLLAIPTLLGSAGYQSEAMDAARMIAGTAVTPDQAIAVWNAIRGLPVFGSTMADRWGAAIRAVGSQRSVNLPKDDPRVVAYAKAGGFEILTEDELRDRGTLGGSMATEAVDLAKRVAETAATAAASLFAGPFRWIVIGASVAAFLAVGVLILRSGSKT